MLKVQCKKCANLIDEWCKMVSDSPDEELVRDCRHYRTLTNADAIRQMTDEELAAWINKHDCHINLYGYDGIEAVLEWLKQEVESNA